MKKLNLAVSLIICLTVCSCSSVRRDQRHVGYITARPALISQITQIGNALNPVNMQPTIIVGKDSIVSGKPDLKAIQEARRVIDSLLQIKCPTASQIDRDSLIKAIRKEVRKSVTPDTVYLLKTITTPDTNCIHQYQILQGQNYSLQGQNIQQQKQISELKNSNSKKVWWLAGGGIIALLSIGLLVYLLIKK